MLWNRARRPAEAVAHDHHDNHEIRAAYDRGRRDERKARKRHPILMTLTVAAAMVGGVVIALAAKEGSFARSGGVVDHGLAAAANRAEPLVVDAVDDAGAAVKDAGETLKTKAADQTAG